MAEAQVTPSDPVVVQTESQIDSNEKTRLADLTAKATSKYSVKDYDSAAEFYSQATELQAEINGEMSSQNADLLYAYGRCLYHLAVKNSDVLGSKVAGEKHDESKKTGGKKSKKQQKVEELHTTKHEIAEEAVTKVVEQKDGPVKPEDDTEKPNKPYFQFTGDDNWDTSEDEYEEDEDENQDGDQDEEDDFANAYEVLDLARVLLSKKLHELESSAGKAKEEQPGLRQLKERLADTYDLQAEISLEGERFPAAVTDLKSALELKLALFLQESSLIAEAHYKLALALEFSSVTQQKDETGEIATSKDAHVDEAMREEAAREMEAAIASCKLRIHKESLRLSDNPQSNGAAGESKVTKDDIEDVKGMVKEMEQRLVELRQPPVSVNDPNGTGTLDGSNPLSGILGSILGETPGAQKARLEEASKDAKDLTNLVKRKKPVDNGSSKPEKIAVPQPNGKRKVDSAEGVEEGAAGKRARVSDGDDD